MRPRRFPCLAARWFAALPLVLCLLGCEQKPYRVFAAPLGAMPIAAAADAYAAMPGPTAAPAASRRARAAAGGDLAAFAAQRRQWDLNHAAAADLAKLPGIDAKTVTAIIAGRPYKDKRELVRRNLISQAQYDQWKSYLVVHRADPG